MPAPKKKSPAAAKRRPAAKAKPAKARAPLRKGKAAPKARVAKPAAKVAPKPAPRPAPAAKPVLPASLVAAVRALDEKKAEDIRVLRLGSLSTVADYYILATGTSEPHLRALRIELDRVLSETDSKVRGIEAQRDSGWVVVDAFDMLFHLFRPETRAAFRLEALWKDGQDVPVRDILAA